MVAERILFRADASSEMGAGHVMRCLTLAGELAQRGAEIHFVCRPFPGNLNGLIRSSGYHLYELSPPRDVGNESYAAWLGADWHEDAKQCAVIAAEIGNIDWLVVDHYALDERWHRSLRKCCQHILVIDDLADRDYDCDVLLDMTLGRQEKAYANRIPEGCKQLLGADYSMLRPQFSVRRDEALRRRESVSRVERILVSMGGSDPCNATGLVLEALSSFPVAVDVVLGKHAMHAETVEIQAESMGKRVRMLRQVEDMAALMVEADLALGTPGTTSWERCCLGLPSLLITAEENQTAIAAALKRAGAAVDLGWLDELSVEQIAAKLHDIISNPMMYRHMIKNASRVTDGFGVMRVAEAMAL